MLSLESTPLCAEFVLNIDVMCNNKIHTHRIQSKHLHNDSMLRYAAQHSLEHAFFNYLKLHGGLYSDRISILDGLLMVNQSGLSPRSASDSSHCDCLERDDLTQSVSQSQSGSQTDLCSNHHCLSVL